MFDPDVISFAHGEGLRRPHPAAITAGIHALLDVGESTLEDYHFLRDCPALEDAIEHTMAAEGAPTAFRANRVVESGSTRLLFAALFTLLDPGDTVLTAPGYYHPLAGWTHLCRVNLGVASYDSLNPGVLTASSLGRWDEEIHAGRLPAPRMIMVANPTMMGTVYTREDLAAVAEFADRWRCIVVEDRVFARTCHDPDRPEVCPPFSAVAPHVRSICVHGVTKSECLANVRIGWACGDRDLLASVRAFSTATSASIPELNKLIAAGALRAPGVFVRENAQEARARCRLVRDVMSVRAGELGVELAVLGEPIAGHSLYVDARAATRGRGGPVSDSISLVEHLLDEWRVAISPGLSGGLEGMIFRVSFGCVGHDLAARLSQAAELDWAERYVRARRDGKVYLDELLDWASEMATRTRSLQTDWQVPGRRVIEEGLVDRLLPGLAAYRSAS